MATLVNNNAQEQAVTSVADFQIDFAAPPFSDDFWSDAQRSEFPYEMCYVTTAYSFDEGVRAMPIAGPKGTPSRAVRLHGGRCMMTVSWEVRRLGQQPVLPGWRMDDGNLVLLEKHVNPDTPNLMPDGKNGAWSVRGVYVYAVLKPPGEDDALPMPMNAMIRAAYAPQARLPAWQFDHSMLNVLGSTLMTGASPPP